MDLRENANSDLPNVESGTDMFRSEAIKYQQKNIPGTVLFSRGSYRWVLVVIFLLFAFGICFFFAFADYTRRERVSGQVQLTHKIAHIYASVDGAISKRLVVEGQSIEAGTPLFSIESDKRSVSLGKTQEAIGIDLIEKRRQILAEKQRRISILNEQRHALDVHVVQLDAQLRQMRRENSVLKQLIAVNELNLSRYQALSDEGYFPIAQVQQKNQENLDLKARQASIERNVLTVEADLLQTQSLQKNFPFQAENELSAYEQRIADLNVQLAESEGRREIIVFSQLAGRVTTPLYDAGQSVNASTLLVSVVPRDTQFVVHLYVPSKATGFISTGSPVQLRYEAFPYEKFGQYSGRVVEVSRTSLAPTNFQAGTETREPLYRIVVALDKQSISAYGKNIQLEDGMRVDADILLETRKMYEWVLEPLLAITGRYTDAAK